MSKLTQADRDAANINSISDTSIVDTLNDTIELKDQQIDALLDENLLLTTIVGRIAMAAAIYMQAQGDDADELEDMYKHIIKLAQEDAQFVIDNNCTGDTYTLEDLKQGYYPTIVGEDDVYVAEEMYGDGTHRQDEQLSVQDILDWEDRHGE